MSIPKPPELFQYIDELCTVFNNTDESEFKKLGTTIEISEANKLLQSQREDSIRICLEGLSRECEEKEELVESSLASSQQSSYVSRLQQDIKEQEEQAQRVRGQLQEASASLQEQQQKKEELQKLKSTVEEKNTKTLPGLKYDIGLYQNLSGIRWQYDAADNEVKGYVTNNKKIQTFDLDTNQNSQHFITNYLWDLMEPDW